MRTPSKQKLAAAEVATRMRREIERIERVAREKNFPPGAFRDDVVQAVGELTWREREELEERVTVLEDLAREGRVKKHPTGQPDRRTQAGADSQAAKRVR